MSAAFSGAVDLSALASRAQAATNPAPPGAPGGPAGGAAPDAEAVPDRAPTPFVVEVDEQTFQQIIELSNDLLVVIDLHASWSEPSQQLSPVLDRLAAASGGAWILAHVDVDASPRIAQAFGVQSVPTVVAVAAGQPVDAFAGVLPEPEIRTWVAGLLDSLRDKLPGIKAAEDANGGPPPKPEDPRFTAAEELMADEQWDEAAAAYQKILDTEPANAEAASALAGATFYGRVAGLAPDAIAAGDAAPDDVAAQCAAADLELAAGAVEPGFSRLIAAISRASADDRTVLREHLVSLFALFGVDDPQVVAARRALAAALY